MLLAESLLLVILGGLAGLLLAVWGIETIVWLVPSNITFSSLNEIAIDARVLAFTLMVSALTGVLFGLAPAIRAAKTDVLQGLQAFGQTAGLPARGRLRAALVVAQVALSLVLLSGAGLLLRTLVGLQSVDPGFDTRNLVTLDITLRSSKYPEF